MSRSDLSAFEEAELRYYCDWCGAPVGQWCVTKTGQWTGYPHANRYYKAKTDARRLRVVGDHEQRHPR